MNPSNFINFESSDVYGASVDGYKTRERNEAGPSPMLTGTSNLFLISNNNTSIYVNYNTLDVFYSNTGEPGSYVYDSNESLKKLYFNRRSRLPQKIETAISVKNNIAIDSIDTFNGVNSVNQQIRPYITVSTGTYEVYMPTWRAYGEAEGTVSTYKFVSVDGINWQELPVTVANVTPTTDSVPINATYYDYTNGKTYSNLNIDKPMIHWFVKKIQNVWFLWMKYDYQWQGWYYGPGNDQVAYWTKCWISIDGQNFTQLPLSNSVNSVSRGPWNDDSFQYVGGHLVYLSDPYRNPIGTNYKAYIFYSKDMGNTWNRFSIDVGTNDTNTPIALVPRDSIGWYNTSTSSWEYYPGFFVFTSLNVKCMLIKNGDLYTEEIWNCPYYSGPTALGEMNHSFRDSRIVGNVGIAFQSGSSMYFAALPTSPPPTAGQQIKCAGLSGSELVGVSLNNLYVHYNTYNSPFTSLYNTTSALLNYTNSSTFVYTVPYATDSGLVQYYNTPSLVNNYVRTNSITYNEYTGLYSLYSYNSIRQTTDFASYTIRGLPSYLSNNLGTNSSNPWNSWVNSNNGYTYTCTSQGDVLKTTNDWITSNIITGSNIFKTRGYPYVPRYSVFDPNRNKFLMLCQSTTSDWGTPNVDIFSENNGVITNQTLVLPAPVSKLVRLGNDFYAVARFSSYTAGTTNAVYKITYDLASSAYVYSTVYTQPTTTAGNITYSFKTICKYDNPITGIKKLLLFSKYSTGVWELTTIDENGSTTTSGLNIPALGSYAFPDYTEGSYSSDKNIGAFDYVNDIMYYGFLKINLKTTVDNMGVSTNGVSFITSKSLFDRFTQPIGQFYNSTTDTVSVVTQEFGIIDFGKISPKETVGTYVQDNTCVKFQVGSSNFPSVTGTRTWYWNGKIKNVENNITIDITSLYPYTYKDSINNITYTIGPSIETIGNTYYYGISRTKYFFY